MDCTAVAFLCQSLHSHLMPALAAAMPDQQATSGDDQMMRPGDTPFALQADASLQQQDHGAMGSGAEGLEIGNTEISGAASS